MFISATGMICPVGLTAPSACAAMRAGIMGFVELPYSEMRDQPVVGAAIPNLDPRFKRIERLSHMLQAAIKECLEKASSLPISEVPFLIGLAEAGRPGGGATFASSILEQIQKALQLRFHPAKSRVTASGHTAGFECLRQARELIQSGSPAVLVACVDSYLNATSLGWLERQGRLKTENNSNGVIPGEAAAAILLTPAPLGPRRPIAVAGIGFAVEEVPIMSEEPFLGHGLVVATRLALKEANLPLHEIDFRLSDVTGESYGFKEQALMLSRVMRDRKAEFPLWHCVENIGDTGAAASVCHFVRAAAAIQGGYAPGPRALVCGSSISGARSAAILRGDINTDVAKN